MTNTTRVHIDPETGEEFTAEELLERIQSICDDVRRETRTPSDGTPSDAQAVHDWADERLGCISSLARRLMDTEAR